MKPCVCLLLCGWLLSLNPASMSAGGKAEKSFVVGRLFSPVGTVLLREPKKWSTPELYASLSRGDQLLVLPGASGVIQIKEGDVEVTLSGMLPGLTPTSVLGASARLHAGKDVDLDMTLSDGRALIKNKKKDGPIKVRLRIQEDNLDLTLNNKDTVVGIEAYRAWPAGTPFSKKLIKDREPEIHVGIFIIQGKVELQLKTEKHSLQAPAKKTVLYHLSSFGGFRGPVLLDKTPLWVKPGADRSAQATAWYKAVESLRRQLGPTQSTSGVLNKIAFDQNADALVRGIAILGCGAIGEPQLVLKGLNEEKSAVVRRAAVLAMAHGINQSQGADIGLYKTMIDSKVPAGQAEIIMELLHGFAARDLQRPETFESLISYLQHKNIGVRELAAWRLYQMVPQGKNIAFDAGASSEERARSQAAWRKLIPDGKLPPKPHTEK